MSAGTMGNMTPTKKPDAEKRNAEREAALIEQAVGAHGRRRPGSRQALIDVMQLVMYAHTAMLRSSITS